MKQRNDTKQQNNLKGTSPISCCNTPALHREYSQLATNTKTRLGIKP